MKCRGAPACANDLSYIPCPHNICVSPSLPSCVPLLASESAVSRVDPFPSEGAVTLLSDVAANLLDGTTAIRLLKLLCSCHRDSGRMFSHGQLSDESTSTAFQRRRTLVASTTSNLAESVRQTGQVVFIRVRDQYARDKKVHFIREHGSGLLLAGWHTLPLVTKPANLLNLR